MGIKTFELTLDHSKKLCPNILHLAFRHPDGVLPFTPGQFLTFVMEGEEGEQKRRSYSISTIPGTSDLLEVSISYLKGGVASERFFSLAPGDTLKAFGPVGRLIMKDDEDFKRYVMVGTGTGIAPYRSMLPDLIKRLDERPDFEVHILLGVQYTEDALYADDFVAYSAKHPRLHFSTHCSRDAFENGLEPYQHKGYVQAHFDALSLNPEEDIVYLCGNPNMVDDAFKQLVDKGFPTPQIRREKYISSN